MPIYQFRHTITGKVTELHRPIEERDFPLPDGPWERVTVPARIAVVGSAKGVGNTSMDESMRKALYKYEQDGTLERDFTKQQIADAKRVWKEEPAQGVQVV